MTWKISKQHIPIPENQLQKRQRDSSGSKKKVVVLTTSALVTALLLLGLLLAAVVPRAAGDALRLHDARDLYEIEIAHSRQLHIRRNTELFSSSTEK